MALGDLIADIGQKRLDLLSFNKGGDLHLFHRTDQARSDDDIAHGAALNGGHGDMGRGHGGRSLGACRLGPEGAHRQGEKGSGAQGNGEAHGSGFPKGEDVAHGRVDGALDQRGEVGADRFGRGRQHGGGFEESDGKGRMGREAGHDLGLG